jgi:phage host-nuclease inhibitor protein Gam
MRRTFVVASLAGAVALAGLVVLLRPGPSPAKPGKEGAEPAVVKPAAQLPIGNIILYSSGVGYFQREGKVTGNTRIDLSFPAADINDLLKSMVLRDLNGGHVSAVSYDSHDPVDKTLKSFAINLNGNPSFSAILNQARGEKVEAVLQQSNATQPGTLTGVIMGVEEQKQPVGKDAVVEVELLNLWCAEGVRSVKLSEVQRLRFLNPVLDSEVKKALETLALSHDTQKKAVSLSFTGEGEREVRVGYVIENPIWKTSYRLVLNKEGKPFLQGWAVVENPSDEDWNEVGMVLVSGRPISFQMDLYQPLYVPRPMVEPELFASLRPPTYNSAMDAPKAAVAATPAPPPAPKPESADKPRLRASEEMLYEKAETAGAYGVQLKRMMNEGMNLGQGVQSAATASQLGDFFQYALDKPVSLARQKSALLPIVNKEVQGERVSIYNQRTHAKFPLLGFKFKNTTGLHLNQGPITVFEASSYAGDARVLDVQPNEERLISYAVDLGTEVEPVVENPKHTLTKVKVVKGILHSTTRVVESKTYKVNNRSTTDRTLLIEHPFRADFKLTSKEEPVERARDVYRFQLKVPAGKGASQTVTEERDNLAQVVLTNGDDNTIRVFIQSNITSKAAQEALKKALDLKGKVDLTRQELAHQNQQLADIERDQARIRQNLKETPPTAEAYKKYLTKLDSQETEIDKLREQIKKLQADELQQRKDYEGYLANLDVE